MKRKVIIILMCLLSTVTIGYKFINENLKFVLNAQSAPVFQLPKGAKVVLGKYNNKEIVWDIGNDINDYVLMSSIPIKNMSTYDSSFPIISTPQPLSDRERYCIEYSANGQKQLVYCPVTLVENEINSMSLNAKETSVLSRLPFLPSITEVYAGGSLGLSISDRAFKHSDSYLLKGFTTLPVYEGGMYANHYLQSIQAAQDAAPSSTIVKLLDLNLNADPSEKVQNYGASNWYPSYSIPSAISNFNIRPFSLLKKNAVVFAANTAYTDGNWHNYTIDTSNLNENNELNPNKLRIQSSLTASLQDIKRNNRSIQKVVKNQSVDLSVNANTGTNTKMSVLLYDDAGTQLQYYKLGSTTQNGMNDSDRKISSSCY